MVGDVQDLPIVQPVKNVLVVSIVPKMEVVVGSVMVVKQKVTPHLTNQIPVATAYRLPQKV